MDVPQFGHKNTSLGQEKKKEIASDAASFFDNVSIGWHILYPGAGPGQWNFTLEQSEGILLPSGEFRCCIVCGRTPYG